MLLSRSTLSTSGRWYFSVTPAFRMGGGSLSLTNSYSTQLFLIPISSSLTGREAETTGSRIGGGLIQPGEPIPSPY